jgi:hypothetical protein
MVRAGKPPDVNSSQLTLLGVKIKPTLRLSYGYTNALAKLQNDISSSSGTKGRKPERCNQQANKPKVNQSKPKDLRSKPSPTNL